MSLSANERERYSRQIILSEFGLEGQERLKSGKVLIIGAGGLGSPASLYLAAMGLGTIGIIDDDKVAVSNLQRQILYGEEDAGSSKALLAKERLLEANPHISVNAVNERLTRANALDILRGYDVVLDGSDNFSTRYLVNDACSILGIPLVSASILRFEGQLTVLNLGEGPCYRCLFPEPPSPESVPSCAQAGVIGALAGVMGTMMAMEAVKIIAGIGEPLAGRLLLYNGLQAQVREINVRRDGLCPLCSKPRSERKLLDSYDLETCADDSLETTWQDFLRSGMPLIDVREEWENSTLPSGGTVIPMGSLLSRLQELPKREFGIVCASGSRSLTAAAILRSKGIRAKSIRGGMKARP